MAYGVFWLSPMASLHMSFGMPCVLNTLSVVSLYNVFRHARYNATVLCVLGMSNVVSPLQIG